MSFVDDAQKELEEYLKSEQFVKDQQRQRELEQLGLHSSAHMTAEAQAAAEAYAAEAAYIFGGKEQEERAAWEALPFDQKLGYYTDQLASMFGYSGISGSGNAASPGSSTGSSPGSSPGTAAEAFYSPWSSAAQQFGMDRETAYAEHMANTAHQREVADLKAAGLNPVLGISGAGASGVSGSVATGASSSQKGMSSDLLVDAIGATAAVVTALVTKNPSYGYMAGQAVNSIGDMFVRKK